MKGVGMIVENFELNPSRRPIWAWPKLFFTPERDHVNTQTNGLYEWCKYNDLKICISNIYFYIFSRATLNETFTAKYDVVLPRTR